MAKERGNETIFIPAMSCVSLFSGECTKPVEPCDIEIWQSHKYGVSCVKIFSYNLINNKSLSSEYFDMRRGSKEQNDAGT